MDLGLKDQRSRAYSQ